MLNKKNGIQVLVWVGLMLMPVLVLAQPVDRSKLVKIIPANADSLFPWHTKKNLKNQLDTIPVTASQRLILRGGSAATKEASLLLLAKKWNKKVYRVDLSSVFSKYIGQTEKNLNAVFDDAEAKDNILFFDEADALFGKRTNVRDAHDKYANQEVSFLLSRIEDYNGIVILASNYKSKMDSSFLRLFKYVLKAD